MNGPVMRPAQKVAPETYILPAWLPVPGFGVLPVNAFVIRATEPVLIDTGLAALRTGFMRTLGSVLAPESIRWIWLTHVDADHVGNLASVLDAAPGATVVTTFVGMAKMGLVGLPLDRVHLLNPGQELDAGNRRLACMRPPVFDAPETTALFDPEARTFFSADSFGALMDAPAETAADVSPALLREGQVTWATVDAPWLADVEEHRLAQTLAGIESLDPQAVLSAHLPPAHGMTRTLLSAIAAARSAPAFEGPDQATMERLMAGGAAA